MNTLHVLLPPLSRFEGADGLNRLLQRGRELDSAVGGEMAATACFSGGGDITGIAALMRDHVCHDAGTDAWLGIDLAHVRPDMTGVRMLACGDLDLSEDDAEALADALRPLFEEWHMELFTTLPSRWHVRVPTGAVLPQFDSPGDVIGDDLIRHYPEGEGGRAWRRLITEAQILLHEHPLNRERERTGAMAANSIWPWGAGKLVNTLHSNLDVVFADDLLPQALAARAGITRQPVAAFDLASAPAGNVLLDLARSGAIDALCALILDVVRQRAAHHVELHFAAGERWRITPPPRWQFWKKAP